MKTNKKETNPNVDAMIGKKFGELLVTDYIGIRGNYNKWYRCICTCGNTKDVAGYRLRNGNTVSCGCRKSHRRDILGH